MLPSTKIEKLVTGMPTEAIYKFFLVAFCDGEFCWPIKYDWTQFSTIFRCEPLMAVNMHHLLLDIHWGSKPGLLDSKADVSESHFTGEKLKTSNIGFTHLQHRLKLQKWIGFCPLEGKRKIL